MSGETGKRRDGPRRAEPRAPVPTLEWVLGGLGALLLLGTIGFLIWQALGRDEAPPDVRVVVDGIIDLQNGYVVQFRALNQGESTAAELVIEGELSGPDGPIETSEATFDYLPPRSDREGGLFFARDPRGLDLQVRAKGYAKP